MKTRIAFAAVALLLFACGEKTYSLSFVCEPTGGVQCPPGDECPVVPEESSACGDLPAVLGHAPIPIDMARPVGCQARLPYGNPYYGDNQVTCACTSTSWFCGI
jgi:hypothetical protein